MGRADLKRYAEQLRIHLLDLPDAAKVALIGDVEERVFVEISHRRLATLGIPPQVIFDAISSQNAMAASGTFPDLRGRNPGPRQRRCRQP